MKKILLASTILVGTAGVAAADVSFSGSAYAGVGYNITTATFAPQVSADFTASMMTTTDGGLEAGASVTVTGGNVTWDDDYTSGTFGTFSEGGNSVGDATVYLSGDFGKVEVAYDNNGSGAGTALVDWDVTVTYSNTWGDFGMSAYYTMAVDGALGTNGDLGAQATYSFGDYGIDVSYDRDASAANPHTIGAGVTASMSGFTAELNADYNIGAATPLSWDAAAGYSTGPYSVGVQIASDGSPTGPFDYGATASYDLGGGVSLDGSFMHDATLNQNLVTAGVSMAF